MGRSPYKLKRVTRVLEEKLRIEWVPGGKERRGWYSPNGIKSLRISIPHQHGGGKGNSLSFEVLLQLKNSLKVDNQEFNDLYQCPMKGSDFETKIRSMGLI